MQRLTIMVMCLAALVAGCESGDGPGVAPSPTGAAVTSPPPSAHQASALEGTWRTGTVSEADIEATLREAGLEEWIQPLRDLPATDPPADSNVFILEIGEGKWGPCPGNGTVGPPSPSISTPNTK